MGDLGHATKVIAGRDSTVIIRDDKEIAEIPKRVDELWGQLTMAKNKSEKEFIMQRIASLSGGIGVIYVGANSDVEQKEKFDRVDDAVCAVRSALEEGIIPGGGIPLLAVAKKLEEINGKTSEEQVALEILKDALVVPCYQIIMNAGEDPKEITKNLDNPNNGYDVKNGEYGNMMELGIIDPLKVTKNAMLNAVSVATTILSTNAIVTLARTYETGK